jgi:hypothetical protein
MYDGEIVVVQFGAWIRDQRGGVLLWEDGELKMLCEDVCHVAVPTPS